MVAIATHDEVFLKESGDKAHLMNNIELEVGGMTCIACASAIKESLVMENGVRNVEVHLESDTASIDYDPSVLTVEDLVRKIEDQGFSARLPGIGKLDQRNRLRLKTLLAIFFGVSELSLCMLCMHSKWYNQALFGGLSFGLFLETILASSAILTIGRSIISKALHSITQRQPGMDLLIFVGVGTAYMYSVFNTALMIAGSPLGEATFYETVTTLLMSYVVGKYLELEAKERCASHLRNLESVFPTRAFKSVDGHVSLVSTSTITKGDRVWIESGGRIPVDGIALDAFHADESLLTGESVPVVKTIGETVYAGSIAQSEVTIICTGAGSSTLLGQIAKTMKTNTERRPKLQATSDVMARYFVCFILLYSTLITLVWCIIGFMQLAPHGFYEMSNSVLTSAVRIGVTVLTIACPCALGLAAPMAIVVGKSRAAKQGIIISNSQAVDNIKLVDSVAFDKTGTLTVGRPEVVEFLHVNKQFSPEFIWALCASAEARSTHLLGKAVRSFCESYSHNFHCEIRGLVHGNGGVLCFADDQKVLIGSSKFLSEHGAAHQCKDLALKFEETGRTAIYVSIADVVCGLFVVMDQLRSDTLDTIRKLEQDLKHLFIVSGDAWPATRAVADQLRIKEYHAQKSPFDKAEIISAKQDIGMGVCFVGDGINDSPAMGLATLSIAMGTATDLTANSADIVLLKPSLRNVRLALKICESIRRKMIINFTCALSYNIIAIPIASGLLLKYNIYVSPTYSGVFMAMSSLLVLFNSLVL